MKRHLCLTALAIVLCTSLAAQAAFDGVAISGRTGSLGFGGDLTINILDDLNARVGVGLFGLDLDGEISDIDYDFELDLLTYPIMLDWYPFQNDFHLSGGVIINETEVGLDAKYDGDTTINIGGTDYTASAVGTLSGDLSWDRVAPYIGIGWGNAFGQNRRWGFMTDLGVAYTGSPEVALAATGIVASDDLASEEQQLEDDIEDYRFYPVFTLCLYFRF